MGKVPSRVSPSPASIDLGAKLPGCLGSTIYQLRVLRQRINLSVLLFSHLEKEGNRGAYHIGLLNELYVASKKCLGKW